MNRVEKIRIKKENRFKKIKTFFLRTISFIFLIAILYICLEIVDETNRSMMAMENSSFFSWNRLDKNNAEVVFCGDRYLVNIEKVDEYTANIKAGTEYTIKKTKEFARNKGKIVTKLVEDIF